MPEQVDIVDFFKETTLFKKAGSGKAMEGLNDRQRELARTILQIPPRFFHYYKNGKSAARVQKGLQPNGVHTFEVSAGEMAAAVPEDPVILHYPCCGFDPFWNKFITLERVYAEGLETWWGKDITNRVGPFYLDARDVVHRRDIEAARAFYRDRYVISDDAHVQALIEHDVCCRILEPAQLLTQTAA